ncbi:MAG TPA: M35 family metallo-endopeptidase [Burkholderiaceae bacterium]|nr:M35 family metallo-endopeptidase [Burkholderiaceae bacterium]
MRIAPSWTLAAAAAVTALSSAQAAPASKLDVMLSTATPVLRGDVDVTVDVTVTNRWKHAVTVPSSQLPGDDPDTKLFAITRDGMAVDYKGAIVKRSAAQPGETVTIQPGASLTYQVELTGSYDLAADGRYSIEYTGLAKNGGAGANTAPMYLWLEGRSAKAAARPAPPPSGVSLSYTGNCSASQQGAIATAVQNALGYATSARDYLNAHSSATQRYTTWFGSQYATGGPIVYDHFVKETDAFANKPITVDCKCKKANVYAYVYPSQPYKIYVCGAFWAAPALGTDSKAGTLIHEMSHFTVVAGTDDWAYGQANAKALAISDPAKAIDNADSHEYYAENTPALP